MDFWNVEVLVGSCVIAEDCPLDHLEDPFGTLMEMGEVATCSTMLLVTDMITIAFGINASEFGVRSDATLGEEIFDVRFAHREPVSGPDRLTDDAGW